MATTPVPEVEVKGLISAWHLDYHLDGESSSRGAIIMDLVGDGRHTFSCNNALKFDWMILQKLDTSIQFIARGLRDQEHAIDV